MTERLENQDQIEYWDGKAGLSWTEYQTTLDQMLAPLTGPLLDQASIAPGQHVLDVGCGCGEISLKAKVRTGENGSVTGMDISSPMLQRARERGETENIDVEWVHGDVSTYQFKEASLDQIVSRFGVMFFENPTKAFSNLRPSLNAGGKLTFICWQPLQANAWAARPLQFADGLVESPQPPDGYMPGPFAFSDPHFVSEILKNAGFKEIDYNECAQPLELPGETEAELMAFYFTIGPLARLNADAAPAQREELRSRVQNWIKKDVLTGQFKPDAACWIFSAAT